MTTPAPLPRPLDERPRLLLACACAIGENPLWHAERRELVFIDIPVGDVHAYAPRSGRHALSRHGRVIGGMTIEADGALLLFEQGTIAVVAPDGRRRELLTGLCAPGERFNDVTADPLGRVYAGTVVDDGRVRGRSRLLRIDLDGSVHQLLDGYDTPNGLGFSPESSTVYFTDSARRTIIAFDYDIDSGGIARPRAFVEFPADAGCPDGLAVDAEGCVWTALWHGCCLRRYDADGRLEREVRFPVRQVASLAFGGEDLGDIFVTTAASEVGDGGAPPRLDRSIPRGGDLYGLRLAGIRGRPAYRSRIASGIDAIG